MAGPDSPPASARRFTLARPRVSLGAAAAALAGHLLVLGFLLWGRDEMGWLLHPAAAGRTGSDPLGGGGSGGGGGGIRQVALPPLVQVRPPAPPRPATPVPVVAAMAVSEPAPVEAPAAAPSADSTPPPVGTGTMGGAGLGPGSGDGSGGGRGGGWGAGLGPGRGPSEGSTEPGRVIPPEPRQLILPPLDYPQALRGRTFAVTFFVSVTGQVERVEVEPSIEDRGFARRFVEVMRQYRFRSARTAEGTPVPGTTTVLVTF